MTAPPSPPRSPVPVPDRPPNPARVVHAEEPESTPHAVPRGTLVVIAALLLALIFLWMLVQGILQGRA